jgi:nucleotide-binding universal stress UspA family protein
LEASRESLPETCLIVDGSSAAPAAEQGSDLILVGAQGLESSGPMLGGVARKLANSATVSCLIVR